MLKCLCKNNCLVLGVYDGSKSIKTCEKFMHFIKNIAQKNCPFNDKKN